jgi:hypothetical protein
VVGERAHAGASGGRRRGLMRQRARACRRRCRQCPARQAPHRRQCSCCAWRAPGPQSRRASPPWRAAAPGTRPFAPGQPSRAAPVGARGGDAGAGGVTTKQSTRRRVCTPHAKVRPRTPNVCSALSSVRSFRATSISMTCARVRGGRARASRGAAFAFVMLVRSVRRVACPPRAPAPHLA